MCVAVETEVCWLQAVKMAPFVSGAPPLANLLSPSGLTARVHLSNLSLSLSHCLCTAAVVTNLLSLVSNLTTLEPD